MACQTPYKGEALGTASKNQSFDRWHFSRRQVAESYLKTLSSGVLLSTTIYAAPQTGLSHFLVNDILPCALEDKYIAVYVDLSNPAVPVTAVLLRSLERVLAGSSMLQSSFNFFRGIFQAKDENEYIRLFSLGNVDVLDAQYFIEKKDEHFFLIEKYFKKLRSYGSVILVVDHAHNISKYDRTLGFSTYLKNIVESNYGVIRPLYATSDLQTWSGIFENRFSPLYSEGAFVHRLPHLGNVYVRDLMVKMKLNVSMGDLVKCFEMIGYRPGIFMAMLLGWKNTSGITLFDYFIEQKKEMEQPFIKEEKDINFDLKKLEYK